MEKIAYLGVDEKSLRERWKEVKEDFWGDLKRETLRALPQLLETRMQIQAQDFVGSAPGKHNARRETYIERTFREVRRRTRPTCLCRIRHGRQVSCFQNRESVERIIFAVFYRLNKIWGEEHAQAA